MSKTKHLYPGGNTCLGFYSFYDYMTLPQVSRKIVLKGGPGVGKSTFMKKLAQECAESGMMVEYHWCSSDNQSLDGIVLDNHRYCILDGTAPHIVDPRFPAAVDEIINLGEYWNRTGIALHRPEIIALTNTISMCFTRAYLRLKEAYYSYAEWISYNEEACDMSAVKRNTLALSQDFLHKIIVSDQKPRHLFAGAITPEGVVNRVESLIDQETQIFAIKGSPGAGQSLLFNHILRLIELNQLYAEIYHNPFNPEDIDIIILPDCQSALIDISGNICNYADKLSNVKFKRILDYDQFLKTRVLDPYAKNIFSARSRFEDNIKEAVSFIQVAKKNHDELEAYYVPHMDFDAIDDVRKKLVESILAG